MREKEDEEEVVADWKFAAMVIDRLVGIIFHYYSIVMAIDRSVRIIFITVALS
jgi:hypothetical protein